MMNRIFPHLFLCFGLALAGCTPAVSERTAASAPKELRVDFVKLRHIAAFGPGKTDLAGEEVHKLDTFLDASDIGPDDHVYLQPAAEDHLTAARIGRLSKEMSRRGIGAQTLPEGAAPADSIAVIVERYVITPPDCPNWTSPTYGDHGNAEHTNLGCANATNLGLMIADPRDLVIGRKLGPVEGDAALASVRRYQAGQLKGLGGSASGGGASASAASSGGGGGGQ